MLCRPAVRPEMTSKCRGPRGQVRATLLDNVGEMSDSHVPTHRQLNGLALESNKIRVAPTSRFMSASPRQLAARGSGRMHTVPCMRHLRRRLIVFAAYSNCQFAHAFCVRC